MRTYLLLIGFLIALAGKAFSQIPGTIDFSGGADDPIPEKVYWYEYKPPTGEDAKNCNYNWSTDGQTLVTTSDGNYAGDATNKRVYIKWLNSIINDHPDGRKVTVSLTGCDNTELNGFEDLEVDPKYLPAPIIQNAGGASITTLNVPCYTNEITLKVAAIPDREFYHWELPAGWSKKGSPGVNAFSTTSTTVEVTVAEGTSNTSIKVHASVGTFSGPSSTLQITRSTDQINITSNPVVYCSSIAPVTYQAKYIPELTYNWTYPSGWSCQSGCNSSTITLIPNGSNVQGQTITARASISCAGQNIQTNLASANINVSTAVSPDFTISGPELVCSSGSQFLLSNVAPTASITWTATPSNLFTVSSGSGANATLTAANNANGQGTLTFTINSNCGNQLQVQRTVWIGLTQYLYFSASYNQSQGIMLSTPYVGGGATAQWSVNGVQHAGFDIAVQPLCIDYTYQNLDITLTVSNQCDSKSVCTSYTLKCPPGPMLTNMGACGGGGGGEEPEFYEEYQYSVLPNPANQLLSISVATSADFRNTSESFTRRSKSATTIQSIALTDLNGFIKYSRHYSSGLTIAEIDVSDLQKGVYILKISNGKHIETHRVIVD
jgi:hypothetical protein